MKAAIPVRTQWKVHPVNEWVQFKRIEVEGTEKSKGGIIIPADDDRQVQAIVIAVGDGARKADGSREPPPCKPGDRIIFHGDVLSFVVNGEPVFMVRQQQVFAVLEQSDVLVASAGPVELVS